MNIMMNEPKGRANSSDFETDSSDLQLRSKIKTLRLVDRARIVLTVTCFLAGIVILGVSADALAVYNQTHVPADFLLPLWPDQFDLRPTVALVVGSTIIVVVNFISLVFHKVQFLRNRTRVHMSQTFIAPFVGLIAALIAMVFFYVINESTTVDTLQSWSCRWQYVFMAIPPQFGTLCKQSQAGLYLSVLLIPIEAVTLAVAAFQAGVERHINSMVLGRKAMRQSPEYPLRNGEAL